MSLPAQLSTFARTCSIEAPPPDVPIAPWRDQRIFPLITPYSHIGDGLLPRTLSMMTKGTLMRVAATEDDSNMFATPLHLRPPLSFSTLGNANFLTPFSGGFPFLSCILAEGIATALLSWGWPLSYP